ncbi:DUF3311 domain-containing protein [Pendulispora albinea]|uniref:DUF3311 domain-containing protein n=1 Tax=Pendulispora albinea TaxID=2741071 RepID=A0ABZ2LS17_9BACT
MTLSQSTRYLLAAPLLAAPLVAILLPATYNKMEPTLFGFPFFYWYQLLWVVLTMASMSGAYFLVVQPTKSQKRGGPP